MSASVFFVSKLFKPQAARMRLINVFLPLYNCLLVYCHRTMLGLQVLIKKYRGCRQDSNPGLTGHETSLVINTAPSKPFSKHQLYRVFKSLPGQGGEPGIFLTFVYFLSSWQRLRPLGYCSLHSLSLKIVKLVTVSLGKSGMGSNPGSALVNDS